MLKLSALVIVLILLISSFVTFAFISSNENIVESKKSEFSWSVGDPFPKVDGHNIFPPSGSSPLASAEAPHWYAGSVCTWSSNHSARSIGMTITIPYSTPRSDEFYYILLSAWDSAGSYDQIGFSDYYGTWGLVYSWTTGPANNLTFHYAANALALSTGSTYTFDITTQNGVSSFTAYQGNSQIWSLNAPTGGDHLVLSTSYAGSLNYANYEEIWYTSVSDGSPAFDFHFSQNSWVSVDGQTNPSTDWMTYYYKAPGDVAVSISSTDVLVDNPNGTVLFQTNLDMPEAAVTFNGLVYASGQTDVFSSGNYYAAANAPLGYQFDHWEYSGYSGEGVYILNSGQDITSVQVNGDGFIKAVFTRTR